MGIMLRWRLQRFLHLFRVGLSCLDARSMFVGLTQVAHRYSSSFVRCPLCRTTSVRNGCVFNLGKIGGTVSPPLMPASRKPSAFPSSAGLAFSHRRERPSSASAGRTAVLCCRVNSYPGLGCPVPTATVILWPAAHCELLLCSACVAPCLTGMPAQWKGVRAKKNCL